MNDEIPFKQKNQMIEIQSDNLDITLRTLLNNNIPLDQLQIKTPNLEDLFLDLTGHNLRDWAWKKYGH